MSMQQIVLLSVAGLVATSAAAICWLWFRGDAADRRRRRASWRARRALWKARLRYRWAVTVSRLQLRRAERSHGRKIGRVEAKLAGLNHETGKRLGGYKGIVLYERHVRTPQGQGPVMGAQAHVDTAGNLAVKSRATLTRMAAGGVVLGALGSILSLGFQKHKEIDKRELYLLVEGPGYASVVQCPPDDGQKARTFAAKINAAAARATTFEQQRPHLISEAQHELKAAHADTGTIETARAQYAAVQNDPELGAAIDEAAAALQAASDDAGEASDRAQ